MARSPCARPAGRVRRPGQPPLPRPADACPECGPRLQSADRHRASRSQRPIRSLTSRLPCGPGQIGALKGLGGYHLALRCRQRGRGRRTAPPQAPRRKAVRHHGRRPRRRRGAVRGRSEPNATCSISPRRPIVLLRTPSGMRPSPTAVAPGNPWLGVMLPYTPLHHLLCCALASMPAGDDQRQSLRRADRLSTTTTPWNGWPASPISF